MLLNLLKGMVFIFSATATISLAAAIIESRVQRGFCKDADYLLAISLFRPLAKVGLAVSIITTLNYSYRFYRGLPGSVLPGPEANSIISLASITSAFIFLTFVGALFLWVLWQSYEPSEEELARRDRITRAQIDAEAGAVARRQREDGGG